MINVGIIGVGYWGPKIVRNCTQIEEYNIVTICDLNSEALANVKNKYNLDCQTTTNHLDIINNPKIDTVIVITPVKTHYKLVKAALLANKDVLVEKPLTDSYQKALELESIAKENGCILMCDHTYCYHSIVTYIKAHIKEWGNIMYIDSTRINLGLFQSDINVIWDLAPHDISIILFLLGDLKLISVNCSARDICNTGYESLAHLDLHFSPNIHVHININWLSPVKVRKIIIGCEKKMIVWDDNNVIEKLKIYNKGVDIDSTNKNKIIINYRHGDIVVPNIDETESIYTMLIDFAQSINSRSEPKSGIDLSKNVVKIIEMAIESNNQRKTIYT